jgi:FAD binding domain/Berberine and berberine like
MLNPDHTLDAAKLGAAIDGEIHRPGEPGWDVARSAWNLAVDQHPDLVAMPAGPNDVVLLVDAARRTGLQVAVQGTGHSAAGYEDLSRTMLIRTMRMREVEVDPDLRIARVAAGALWGDVVGPARDHGLFALQGSSHDVGVVGYSLGGGVSFLSRKHGLASERIRAAEIVTADGRLRRVDASEGGDLFWALRGGGGNYGVVTALEIELLDLRELYAGTLFFPFERAREILQAWREWTGSVPREMSSIGRLLQFPPLPEIPEPMRGNSFVAVESFWLGAEQQGRRLLEPLRALGPRLDTVTMIDAVGMLEVHMDPPGPVPGLTDHLMLRELTAEALDALVDAAGPGSGSPLLSFEIRHLGGALAERPEGAGALGSLDGEFATFAVGVRPDPDAEPPIREAFARTRAALAPVAADSLYVNFVEEPIEASPLYGSEQLARLRRIRRDYDPDGLFRANHPIEPGP